MIDVCIEKAHGLRSPSPSFSAKAGNPEILAVKNARVPFDKFRDRLPLYGQRVASDEPTEPVEVSVIS